MKKTIGLILMLLGCILIGVFISRGLIFPHLMGPSIILVAGMILFFAKRKTKSNEKNTL